MAEKEKKAPEAPKSPAVCKAEFLHNAGLGVWVYRETGVSEEDVREAGFFAGARTRFGMRGGDVVLVNAGAGRVHLVGV